MDTLVFGVVAAVVGVLLVVLASGIWDTVGVVLLVVAALLLLAALVGRRTL